MVDDKTQEEYRNDFSLENRNEQQMEHPRKINWKSLGERSIIHLFEIFFCFFPYFDPPWHFHLQKIIRKSKTFGAIWTIIYKLIYNGK